MRNEEAEMAIMCADCGTLVGRFLYLTVWKNVALRYVSLDQQKQLWLMGQIEREEGQTKTGRRVDSHANYSTIYQQQVTPKVQTANKQ
jgi:hypothetical protein